MISGDNYFANLIAAEKSKLDAWRSAAGHPSDLVADNGNKAKLPQ
jgi:hypothetical protein